MTTLHEMPSTIRKYLDELGAHYEVIDHPREVDAQRTAAVTHTPGAMFAKCLLVKIDGVMRWWCCRRITGLTLRCWRRRRWRGRPSW